MRAIIQRVKDAQVAVKGEIVGEISKGLVVLVGYEDEDNLSDINWLVGKINNMRIFGDADGKMNLSIKDVNGDLILISQFTLFASTKKGNRPSFLKSAKPNSAIPLYESTIKAFEQDLAKPIQTGIFGADMQVSLCNDGPVTISLDSKNKF